MLKKNPDPNQDKQITYPNQECQNHRSKSISKILYHFINTKPKPYPTVNGLCINKAKSKIKSQSQTPKDKVVITFERPKQCAPIFVCLIS